MKILFLLVILAVAVSASVFRRPRRRQHSGRYMLTDPCPMGIRRVACFVAPCSVRPRCGDPSSGNWTCMNDYCGGCNRAWFDGQERMTCQSDPEDSQNRRGRAGNVRRKHH